MIEVKNAKVHNLKNISLKIPLNQLVVIAGPSGSGKSTLVYDVLLKKKLPEDIIILDEPCSGFTKQECKEFLKDIKKKIKENHSAIIISHSKHIIKGAEHIIEFGPKGGAEGGYVVFQGSINKFKNSSSYTKKLVYKTIKINKKQPKKRNLKLLKLSIPLFSLVAIEGSMKKTSNLLFSIYRATFKGKNAWKVRLDIPVKGKENIRRSYIVERKRLSNNPRSYPITYLSIWDEVRKLFEIETKLPKSNFIIKENFPKKVLNAKYKNMNIKQVLELTIDQAIRFFQDNPLIFRKLSFLKDVGLGYLTLGQPSKTLSGGESQRVRLAKILSKKLGDRCLYSLDNPSQGLHLGDLPRIITILKRIVNKNNTVLITENKEEILAEVDFKIKI